MFLSCRYIALLFLTTIQFLFAQKQANHWYFGNSAGLDFTNGAPVEDLQGQLITSEGCASISDSDGNLLFYTDGYKNTYNRNHQRLLNSGGEDDLANGTDLMGNPSSTQSAIIVPYPGQEHLYYIFTVDAHDSNPFQTYTVTNPDGTTTTEYYNQGFRYSLVDMTLDNGLGAIVENQKNISIPLGGTQFTSEKVSAVLHENGEDIWLITHYVDTFYAYLITENGFNPTPVTSTIGPNLPMVGYPNNARGYLKCSPNGKKLVVAHMSLIDEIPPEIEQSSFNHYNNIYNYSRHGGLYLYDFDAAIGIISNEINLGNKGSYYGVEFSSNSNFLYAEYDDIKQLTPQECLDGLMSPSLINTEGGNHEGSYLVQFDLTNPNPINTETVLYDDFTFCFQNATTSCDVILTGARGALQLAPDKKIYYSKRNNMGLGIINLPNSEGVSCDFEPYIENASGFQLSTMAQYGLPPFIQSFFNISFSLSSNCQNQEITFTISDLEGIVSVLWNFGDGTTSTELQPTHTYSNAGTYEVSFQVTYDDGLVNTYTKIVEIYTQPSLTSETITQDFCDENNDLSELLNLEDFNELFEDENSFSFSYFLSEEEALENINPIDLNYELIGDTTLYVRVFNPEDEDCFVIGILELTLKETPFLDLEDAVICFNSSTVIDAGNEFTSYLWSTGETTQQITITEEGTYSVTVSLTNGCQYTETFQITLIPEVIIQDTLITDNSITIIINGVSSDYLYSIDGENFQESSTFNNLISGVYTIIIKDIYGCNLQERIVPLLSIPNVFTPNGDGYNDTWTIPALDLIPDARVRIYDRYGKLLLDKPGLHFSWDGNYLGELVPPTDYWYYITLPDGRSFKGHLTIKRKIKNLLYD